MPDRHGEDRRLAKAVVDANDRAWTEFVQRYSGLMFSIIHRYLLKEDHDEHRTLYVRVLEECYHSRLRDYDGRSSLATWIATVTRSRCLDYLRSRYGRRSFPGWLTNCTPTERDIYAMHYMEGMSHVEIVARLRKRGENFSVEDLVDALHNIDARMSRPMRRRMASGLQFPRDRSEQLAELREELCRMAKLCAETQDPEYQFFLKENRKNIDLLRTFMSTLPDTERNAIRLYYFDNLTAKHMAARLGLGNQRRAYTVLNRAVRKLRRMFEQRIPAASRTTQRR